MNCLLIISICPTKSNGWPKIDRFAGIFLTFLQVSFRVPFYRQQSPPVAPKGEPQMQWALVLPAGGKLPLVVQTDGDSPPRTACLGRSAQIFPVFWKRTARASRQ